MLLLIAIISFMFFTRAFEYIIINHETQRIGSYYRSIGYLTPDAPWAGDLKVLSEAIEVISSHPSVAMSDRRRYCSGVMENTYNADIFGGSSDHTGSSSKLGIFVSDVLFYGEVIAKQLGEGTGNHYLEVAVDTVVAGYPDYISIGDRVRLAVLPQEAAGYEDPLGGIEPGTRCFLRACYDIGFAPSSGDGSDIGTLLRLKPVNGDAGPWYLSVEDGVGIDLSDPMLSGLVRDLDILNQNLHAISVWTSQDMSAMPQTQELAMHTQLEDGRLLTLEDNSLGRRVCVVSQRLAQYRSLNIGDTLSITLRDTQSIYGYLYTGTALFPGNIGNWQSLPAHKEDYEIVGIFSNHPSVQYDCHQFVFIPDTSMPADFCQTAVLPIYDPNWYYSFTLKSAREESAFLQEVQPALSDSGFSLNFVDHNALEYWAAIDPILRSAKHNVIIFCVVLFLGFFLVAFLYLRFQYKNFAVMRALGMPSKRARGQIILPMACLGGSGIVACGFLSWNHALAQAASTLGEAYVSEEMIALPSLSAIRPMTICACVFVLMITLLVVGAFGISRQPVLGLLQGGIRGEPAPTQTAGHTPASKMSTLAQKPIQASAQQYEIIASTGNKARPWLLWANTSRYVMKHIGRARMKFFLTVVFALCSVIAVNWLSIVIERSAEEIDRLYASAEVTAEIQTSTSQQGMNGSIGGKYINYVLDSGFVKSHHLEGVWLWQMLGLPPSQEIQGTFTWVSEMLIDQAVDALYFDNPEIFLTQNAHQPISYLEGWDATLFAADWHEADYIPVVVPEIALAWLGLDMGEPFYLIDLSLRAFQLRGLRTDDPIMPCIAVGMYAKGADLSIYGAAPPILAPISGMHVIQTHRHSFNRAEFKLKPEKNRELEVLKTTMSELIDVIDPIFKTPMRFVVYDGELRQVVAPIEQRLTMLSVLYPVLLALSLIAGGVLALLLTMQSTQEAAIMRVLGRTRRLVRIILCAERLLPCLIGELAGVFVIVLIGGNAGHALLYSLFYLSSVLVGTMAAAVRMTNRPPLELLQVRE